MRLSNKAALITAAGQGIGRAVALAFAREGASVLATDINEQSLASLQAEHNSIEVQRLDVTDADAVARLASGRAFNVVFNCAGVVHPGTILDCSPAQMEFAWRLNVGGTMNICRALLPSMIAGGGGSIINMSSVASSIKGVANRFAYSTTKAAVIGLTKSIAIDFLGMGIRCNAICPGTVDTPSLAERIETQAQAQSSNAADVRRQFEARQPMGRLGKPDEIAALAVYLASDESAFTTGVAHVIDGAWTL
jgi:2-keto-3-deoxy-L-fuconate dehydrogenase